MFVPRILGWVGGRKNRGLDSFPKKRIVPRMVTLLRCPECCLCFGAVLQGMLGIHH